MFKFLTHLIISISLVCPIPVFAKKIEIVFWHSMAGQLGEEVNNLANKFNQSQQKYSINPLYKGDYNESLTSFAVAFRAQKPPGPPEAALLWSSGRAEREVS